MVLTQKPVHLISFAAAAAATDCERPPHVDHASVNLADDETDDMVSATYVCTTGYRLHGAAKLLCDLDTDEWQSDPPACRPGNWRVIHIGNVRVRRFVSVHRAWNAAEWS